MHNLQDAEPRSAAKASTLAKFNDLTQVCLITPDMDSSIVALRTALGAGTFKVLTMDEPALFNRSYGGGAEAWSMRLGISWIGGMQVEVIQPLEGRTVFRDYLEARGNRAGIQHLFLARRVSYPEVVDHLKQAGYPLRQHAQMNVAGRLGLLPLPALPRFLAGRYSTQFGYTSTQATLKVDVEVAKFPPGVSQRLALRAAIADYLIPAGGDLRYFERPGSEALLADLDAVYVLGRNVEALADDYARLTTSTPRVWRYDEQLLPGTGRAALIQVGKRSLYLIETEDDELRGLIESDGEGVRILRGRPFRDLVATQSRLSERGWRTRASAAGVFATHAEVPFALWVQP